MTAVHLFTLFAVQLSGVPKSSKFFIDSHSALEYLLSGDGKQAVVDIHVEGITEYLNTLPCWRYANSSSLLNNPIAKVIARNF